MNRHERRPDLVGNQTPADIGALRTIIEDVLDFIAAKLGYDRPRGQYWPEVLMLLPVVVFSMYSLSSLMNLVTGDALSRAWSPVEARWPIVKLIEVLVFGLSFLSLGAFAIFHGIKIQRTSTTVLGVFLLLLPATVVALLMTSHH